LFLVPNIRTSKYLSLLAEACPEIANSAKGDIQAEEVPLLKVGGKLDGLSPFTADARQYIVAVDNVHDAQGFQTELDNCKSAVDFREILIRDQSSREERESETLRKSLDEHDVINLQFTR